MRNSTRVGAGIRVRGLSFASARFRAGLAAALSGLSFLLLLSCSAGESKPRHGSGNEAPVIRSITVTDRVHIRQKVVVAAAATDHDNDLLGYVWTATRGTFPAGNSLASVVWQSPAQGGTDTLTVVVSDADHSVTGKRAVPLVGVAAPDSLDFVLGTSIADLLWMESVDDGIDLFRGYEVYRATHPLPDAPADSLLRYLITPAPIPGGRVFRATSLVRGVRYHFRVTAVRSWEGGWQRSPFSPEVDLSPYWSARSDLSEIQKAERTAWALDLSRLAVPAFDPTDTTGMGNFDLYLGTLDPEDGPGALTLKSVSRLQYLHPGWAERRVGIKAAGTDWDINTTTDDGWQEEVVLEEEQVYLVRLPEGNYAKLQVPANGTHPGVWPHRAVLLRWAYQSIPNYPVF